MCLSKLAANAADTDRILFSQLHRAESGLYTATSRDWKYVYSAPDQRELFFDLARDPGETTDLWSQDWCLRPAIRTALNQHRNTLPSHLHTLGETGATEDGKSWRPWPKTEFPANPQAFKLFQDHPWATDIQTPPEYSR